MQKVEIVNSKLTNMVSCAKNKLQVAKVKAIDGYKSEAAAMFDSAIKDIETARKMCGC